MDVSHHREKLVVDELWLVARLYFYCSCWEPKIDPAQVESRHDALDSPSTLGIRVPSPLAWGRNSVHELRGQRQHALGDGGGGSTLTASAFSLYEYEMITCYRLQRQQCVLRLYTYN